MSMNQDFFDALELMAKEKGLELPCLVEKVKDALVLALRKEFPGNEDYTILLDTEAKEFDVTVEKTVVETVSNKAMEISLEDAKKRSKKAKVGSKIKIKLEPGVLGRLAAQMAKQSIRQGVRDAEREVLNQRMGDKVGKIVSARVINVEPRTRNAMLDIDGYEFPLYRSDQLPNDRFRTGDIIKVYIVGLSNNTRRCSLKISRTHKDMISCLFRMQVPEIEDGIVEIKAISREAGFRSKMAVYSYQENVDPIGACIGPKSARINAVLEELGHEKIDIITYSDDPAKLIARALAPAKVVEVKIVEESEENRVAVARVEDSQLSLAIGNRGQNVRLAARLTGYKIDIQPESGFYSSSEEDLKPSEEPPKKSKEKTGEKE